MWENEDRKERKERKKKKKKIFVLWINVGIHCSFFLIKIKKKSSNCYDPYR